MAAPLSQEPAASTSGEDLFAEAKTYSGKDMKDNAELNRILKELNLGGKRGGKGFQVFGRDDVDQAHPPPPSPPPSPFPPLHV